MAQSKHVLLIEDQHILQQLMLFELQQFGYQVSTADDGVQALEKLKQGHFDVIVCDLFMPKMGGIELIEALRECSIEVPIVVLSGSRSQDIKQKLVALEVPHFIDKPITDDKLMLLNHLIEAL